MAINPRVKGHAFELKIRDWFRELGWIKSVSSRSESKNKDDQGIDLCYTDPFNIQGKDVEKLGVNMTYLQGCHRMRTIT